MLYLIASPQPRARGEGHKEVALKAALADSAAVISPAVPPDFDLTG